MSVDFFSFERVIRNFPKVLSKFPVTINIVLVSTAIALVFGTIIALLRIKKIPVFSQLAAVYVSFVRGTPILVQLFLIYYGVPILLVGIFRNNITSEWNKLIFVYIAYGLNEAGFMSEHIRAAILSVPVGQSEAGYTIGLTSTQTFLRIVFPQALRVLLPGFSTMFIGLLPATSLAYMLGVTDMMGKIKAIGVSTYHSIEGYFCAAAIFIITSFVLERFFAIVIKHLDYEKKIGKEETA